MRGRYFSASSSVFLSFRALDNVLRCCAAKSVVRSLFLAFCPINLSITSTSDVFPVLFLPTTTVRSSSRENVVLECALYPSIVICSSFMATPFVGELFCTVALLVQRCGVTVKLYVGLLQIQARAWALSDPARLCGAVVKRWSVRFDCCIPLLFGCWCWSVVTH